MTESVTDIIVSRSQRHEQMTPMVAGSIVAHATVFGALLMLPSLWMREQPPRMVMEITRLLSADLPSAKH